MSRVAMDQDNRRLADRISYALPDPGEDLRRNRLRRCRNPLGTYSSDISHFHLGGTGIHDVHGAQWQCRRVGLAQACQLRHQATPMPGTLAARVSIPHVALNNFLTSRPCYRITGQWNESMRL